MPNTALISALAIASLAILLSLETPLGLNKNVTTTGITQNLAARPTMNWN